MDLQRHVTNEAIRLLAYADSLGDDANQNHVVMSEGELRGLLEAAGMKRADIDLAVHTAFSEHGAAKLAALDDTWSRDRCPACGGRPVPIVYGMPGSDLIELSERGFVALGGCVVEADQPTVRCQRCGNEWQG